MAKQRKVKVLDSYQTLRAVRTASGDAPTTAPKDRSPAEVAKPLGQTGRTTVPSRQIIICHECGYRFQLHGRVASVPCSKCRADLDLTRHEITGPWAKSFKTAATIHIKSGGIIQGADLVGKLITLEGRLEEGSLRALERLDLGPGARFPEDRISTVNLGITAGAAIAFQQPVTYQEVELFGRLRANLTVRGTLVIHPGGVLEGELQTSHLRVEEGGGLLADVRVG